MHESTSRFLCQAAFACLGFLPLILCLGWAALQYVPFYHSWQDHTWERRLSTAIGYQVQVGSVRQSKPRQLILEDLELFDPEDEKILVGRADEVVLNMGSSQWRLVLRGAELEGQQLKKQWLHFHDHLLCRPHSRPHARLSEVVLQADKLTLRDGTALPVVLEAVSGTLWSQAASDMVDSQAPAQTNLRFGFQLGNPDESCDLRVQRIHEAGTQATNLWLSANAAIPNQLLQQVWEPAARLGPLAQVRGGLHWRSDARGWTADIGQNTPALLIENVDFGDLTWNAPSEITGKGSLFLQSASFSSAGLEHVQGRVMCQNGRVSQALLLDAQRRIGLRLAESVMTTPIQDIPFRVCSFEFDANLSSLAIKGLLQQGRIIVDGPADRPTQVLVGEPLDSIARIQDLIPMLDSRHLRNGRRENDLPSSDLARRVLRGLPKQPAQLANGDGLQAVSNELQR